MSTAFGFGLGFSFINYASGGGAYTPSLNFSIAANSQYVVILAF